MNLAEIRKLLRLSKAESEAHKAQFIAISSAYAAKIESAEAYAQRRARPFASVGCSEISGGDLSSYGRYLQHLDRAERKCRREAAALEPELKARRECLSRSLGEQTAWARLCARAERARRRRMEERAEAARGDLVSNESTAAKRTDDV